MVSITVITSCSASNQPTLQSQSSISICVATVLSHSRDIQTSRLVAMQQRMQASGISGTVARTINSSKRSSTNILYDYRWKSWEDWCFRRKVNPFNPSVNIFVKFLFSLMIRNSALQQLRDIVPLFQPLLSNFPKWIFSNESILFDVVKSFVLERPRTRPQTPKWDLA